MARALAYDLQNIAFWVILVELVRINMTESQPVKYAREAGSAAGRDVLPILAIVGSVIALPIIIAAQRERFREVSRQIAQKFAPRVAGPSEPGKPGQNF